MDIGLELNLAKSDLEALQDKYKENADKCFTEMLDLWLRTNQTPTLTKLIAALRRQTVGFHRLAEELEKENLKSNTTDYSTGLNNRSPGNNHLSYSKHSKIGSRKGKFFFLHFLLLSFLLNSNFYYVRTYIHMYLLRTTVTMQQA